MIKLEELKEILEIDLTSPSGLKWKVNRNNRVNHGDIAGTLHTTNYYITWINNKQYKNHRLIYALHYDLELNQLPKYIDHIDRNSLNNNPINLRPATHSQNQMNREKPCNNISGTKGVCWDKDKNKWLSQIQVKGKKKYLGRFNTIEEAAKAYREASLKYHGEFSLFTNA